VSDHVWVAQVSDYDDQPVVAVGRTLDLVVAAVEREYPEVENWTLRSDDDDDDDPWYTLCEQREPRWAHDMVTVIDIRRYELHGTQESRAQPEG
jgi:hypothetical protein